MPTKSLGNVSVTYTDEPMAGLGISDVLAVAPDSTFYYLDRNHRTVFLRPGMSEPQSPQWLANVHLMSLVPGPSPAMVLVRDDKLWKREGETESLLLEDLGEKGIDGSALAVGPGAEVALRTWDGGIWYLAADGALSFIAPNDLGYPMLASSTHGVLAYWPKVPIGPMSRDRGAIRPFDTSGNTVFRVTSTGLEPFLEIDSNWFEGDLDFATKDDGTVCMLQDTQLACVDTLGAISTRTLGRAYPTLVSDGVNLYGFTGDNFFRIDLDSHHLITRKAEPHRKCCKAPAVSW